MSKLVKPEKLKKEYFNYHACSHYIEKKYKLEGSILWSWLIDHYFISGNGCNMTLYYDELERMKDEHVKEFALKLFEEFEPNCPEIEFEVSW